jgi:hypothetical protein
VRRLQPVEGVAQEQRVAVEGREHVHAVGDRDEHHLVLEAAVLDQLARALEQEVEARAVLLLAGLHARGCVEQEDDAVLLDRGELEGRLGHGQHQAREDQELEQQREQALQPLEERARPGLDEQLLPEAQVRHRHAPALHLQHVQDDDRQRQAEEPEQERRREAHPTTPPRRRIPSTSSSKGTSVRART